MEKSDFNQALGSIWNWGGILLASVALISLAENFALLDFSGVVEHLIHGYRAVFHGLFDKLILLLKYLWPKFSIPFWVIEFSVIYLILGNSLRRAIWPAFKSIQRHVQKGSPYTEGIAWAWLTKKGNKGAFCHALYYTFLWPFLLITIIKHPILYEEFEEDIGPVESGYWVIRLAKSRSAKQNDWANSRARTGRIMYSLTASFGIQVAASILGVLILAAANGR